jgi:copper chaperone CopZ
MGIRDGIKEFFSSKDDMDYPDSYYDHRILTDPYGRTTTPVMEMRVPLCCDNCEKKVRETLEDMSGVKAVDTDRDSNRVRVTGFVDPVKALRRVRKLKPKSELHGTNTYINRTSHEIERIDVSRPLPITQYHTSSLVHGSTDYDRSRNGKVHYVASPATVLTPMGTPGAPQLVRVNSYGRRGAMSRLNSFGRVNEMRYNRDYDRDYTRREHALVPAVDLQRDYYNIRRMPSLGRHRYHDAEYISMGDEFHPAMAETHYVSAYNQRPSNAVYRSQVSFSKLPVTNPHYMKHLEHEYNY